MGKNVDKSDPFRTKTKYDKDDPLLESAIIGARRAIDRLNDDEIINIITQLRAEGGDDMTQHLVGELLRASNNALTEPMRAACIQTALARYHGTPSGA